MFIFLGMLAFVFLLIGSIGYFISAPKYSGPVSDHFDGKKFINPGNRKPKGFPELLKWMADRKPGEWKVANDLSPGAAPSPRIDRGIRVTFINHSTFLIQCDGMNILTDPVFYERTSPVQWAGPRRMRPPGIRLEDLPKIDVLLLSHNHWDHLDIGTVRKIHALHHPEVITPLGVKSFLDHEGVKGSHELDWWDEVPISDTIRVQSVPAQHFSGRGLFDRDATLWCGYVIRRQGGNIYFVGDTGYNDRTFREIGTRCAPINIALIPIGAYKPKSFMSPIHCSPEEAVKIHAETGTKVSIATHFGTFPLADDGQKEPIEELKKALDVVGIDREAFLVLNEGVPRDFS